MKIFLTYDPDEAIAIIKQSVRVIMVFEPKFGSKFLYKYFSPLKHLDNVDSAILYCSNVENHKKWTADYKIKGKDV